MGIVYKFPPRKFTLNAPFYILIALRVRGATTAPTFRQNAYCREGRARSADDKTTSCERVGNNFGNEQRIRGSLIVRLPREICAHKVPPTVRILFRLDYDCYRAKSAKQTSVISVDVKPRSLNQSAGKWRNSYAGNVDVHM